jgi:hypothetical protein
MAGTSPPRVQFVVSGKFITLLLIGAAFLGCGYYWYSHQQKTQKRFTPPPYFVNRGPTVVRTCKHCVGLTGLKPQSEWGIGPPLEIPATEQRWFLAVEDPPTPVTVAGVLMLPVYPTLRDNPAFGFDESQILLVLYQNVQRMAAIEQPLEPPPVQPPPSPPPAATTPAAPINPAQPIAPISTAPATLDNPPPERYLGYWKNEDTRTRNVTRFLISAAQDNMFVVHAWGACMPVDCEWQETSNTSINQGVFLVLWDQGFCTRRWELSFEAAHLKMLEHVHYNDSRGDQENTEFFSRSSEAP